MRATFAFLLLGLAPLGAQDVKFLESLDKLAAKAKETVNLSFDGPLLKLAGNFLSSKKTEEAKVKRLADGLKGLYIRTYEFAKEGEYTDADLQPMRSQLTSARGWSRIVQVSEPSEKVEVYAKKDGDSFAGMALIACERRELTVVYVDGPFDLKQLGELAGVQLDSDVLSSPKK